MARWREKHEIFRKEQMGDEELALRCRIGRIEECLVTSTVVLRFHFVSRQRRLDGNAQYHIQHAIATRSAKIESISTTCAV